MKLTKPSMLKISYLNKLPFKGSYNGIRYLIKKNTTKLDDGTEEINLLLCVYPDKFCFEKTLEEDKKYYYFDYSNEGIDEAVQFMNEENKW